jgi:uncharacterized protein
MSGRVVHFELPFDDAERARSFYRDVFHWDVQPMPDLSYTMVTTGPSGETGPTETGYINGGMGQRDKALSGPVVVIDVEDIDASLEAVKAHGGTTIQEREPVGEMGWAAYFRDPEGSVIGLWQTRQS